LSERVRSLAPGTTYRSLIVRGLSPAEAGNLTGFISGLPPGGRGPWLLRQVNELLFLRELHRAGRAH
jgi:hypothetical protein